MSFQSIQSFLLQKEQEQERCIDPKLLLRGTGGGVDDPNYNSTAEQEGVDDINLEEHAHMLDERVHPGIVHNGTVHPALHFNSYEQAWLESNNQHHASAAASTPPRSTLRPQAEVFVPLGLEQTHQTIDPNAQHQLATGQGQQVTPSTPQIKVFYAQALPADGGGSARKLSRHNTRVRRHSSPCRRPESLSRSQSRAGLSSTLLPTGPESMHLYPTIPTTPEKWINGPYNVGDRQGRVGSWQTARTILVPAPKPSSSATASTAQSQTSGPYCCEEEGCNGREKQFKTMSELRKHQRTHAPESQRRYKCEACPRRFWHPKDMKRHNNVHEGVREKCRFCNKSISRNDNLNRHIDKVHPNVQAPTSADGLAVASPSSSVTSFTQTSYSGSVPTTPLTMSPLESYTATFSRQNIFWSCDPINERDDPFWDSPSQPPLPSEPMQKSRSSFN